MKILGIDPGLANTGWGVVDYSSGHFRCVEYGLINTDSKSDNQSRISCITERIKSLCSKFDVGAVSIEDIFFAKNELSVMNVAKVIGAINYMSYLMNLKLFTYTPLQIKMSVIGYGRADKHQVQEMTRVLLKEREIPRPDHCADALAAAICHINMNSTLSRFDNSVRGA